MDYRSRKVAVVPLSAAHIHELTVAAIVCLAVYNGLNALSGDFIYFTYQRLVDMSLMCSYDRLCYRMARETLAACCDILEFSYTNKVRMYVIDLENTLCKCSGLIEDNSINLGQDFHIAGALYEDTVLGRTAYAAEERQRNGYHKCTRAGNDQEYAGSCKPFLPDLPASDTEEERRNDA